MVRTPDVILPRLVLGFDRAGLAHSVVPQVAAGVESYFVEERRRRVCVFEPPSNDECRDRMGTGFLEAPCSRLDIGLSTGGISWISRSWAGKSSSMKVRNPRPSVRQPAMSRCASSRSALCAEKSPSSTPSAARALPPASDHGLDHVGIGVTLPQQR